MSKITSKNLSKKASEASFHPFQSRSKSTIIPQIQFEKLNRAESFSQYFKDTLHGQTQDVRKIKEKENVLERLKRYQTMLAKDL